MWLKRLIIVLQIKKLRSRDLRTLIKTWQALWALVLADWAEGSLKWVLLA